jgi:dTDP-4-dehydrorhamnose reductase
VKVAIIGANGQLGSDLVEVFSEEAIPLTHRDLDVADFESVQILNELKPDVVINTAAYVRVDDAEVKVEEAFRVNALGALNVAKACDELNAINVYISTDYVFDGTKNEPYTEDDVPNPINVYGLTKYSGELFTQNYSQQYYIVRVSSLYGKAGSSGKGGNFVDFMIQKARNAEEIKVVDDMFMSPTYTKDVAVMLKQFLAMEPTFGFCHMVNEGYCTWFDFTRDIFSILGRDAEVKPIKSSDIQRLARRPIFSALKNQILENSGLHMRNWKEALKAYLTEEGYSKRSTEFRELRNRAKIG